MSLSDHLVSTIRRDRIEEILDQLKEDDPAERDILAEALEMSAEYSGGDIARALQASGFDPVTANQVNHYRRKKGYN